MSIDQLDKIDAVSTTPDGKVMLTISDHLEWDEEGEHMMILQNKLNAYLQFIEGGQILEDYPQAINKDTVINVFMKYEPNSTSILFLNRCKEILINAGIGFEWKTIIT